MNKKYQSEALMVCHQSAQALFKIGAISDAEMREFDEDCLVPDPELPELDDKGLNALVANGDYIEI